LRGKQEKDSTMTAPLRVAVATRDKIQIDLHFGHADEFAIYALDGGDIRLVETRAVEHYCRADGGSENRRDVILRALADCAALFVARVGDGPREKLAAAGIEPVDGYAYEAVEESLRAWSRQRTQNGGEDDCA
jgi:nitrogen fixation protein NifB